MNQNQLNNLPKSSCTVRARRISDAIAGLGFLLGDYQMVKLCECGCGNPAPIANYTNKNKGYFNGKPTRFIYGHHTFKNRMTECLGRILIYNPRHERSNSHGYVFRSLLVAEKSLGRFIPKGIIVHHFDKNKSNDKKTNLVICENAKYHKLLHIRQDAYYNCGNANWRKCYICNKYDAIENLYISPDNKSVYHRYCKNKNISTNRPRWYVVEFDRNFVCCKSCRLIFFYKYIKRKNKCPHCKIDNYSNYGGDGRHDC